MRKVGVFRQQWGFASPAYISHCGNKCKYSYIPQIRKFPSGSGDSDYPNLASSFVASASSASSVSGSGAEYSGNFNSSSLLWLYEISVICVCVLWNFCLPVVPFLGFAFLFDGSRLIIDFYSCFCISNLSTSSSQNWEKYYFVGLLPNLLYLGSVIKFCKTNNLFYN